MATRQEDKNWWQNYRDDDAVARLFVHYFYPCDLMYKQRQAVGLRIKRLKRPSQKYLSDELSCTKLWLAMLRVVCGGFKELRLKDEAIDKIIDEHLSSLNLFRNGVFHYQKDAKKLTQFVLEYDDTFAWAENLHKQFSRFESDYKVENAVQNLMKGRT